RWLAEGGDERAGRTVGPHNVGASMIRILGLRVVAWMALVMLAGCGARATRQCPTGPTVDSGLAQVSIRDLGSAVGPSVATGSSMGLRDNVHPTCGISAITGAGDVEYRWIAPSDGTYTFDTDGSNYDTVLELIDECTGRVLLCNDDEGGGSLRSRVTVPL